MRKITLGLSALLFCSSPVASHKPAAPPATAAAPLPSELSVDGTRLLSDSAYAERMLVEIDAFQRGNGLAETETLLVLRALAFAGAERGDEARAAIDRLLALRSDSPDSYRAALGAAARVSDAARMVAIVEAAAQRLTDEAARRALERGFDVATVQSLNRYLVVRREAALQQRLTDALLVLGWPGRQDMAQRDAIRMAAVRRHIAGGRRDEAARIAATIEHPAQLVPLMTETSLAGLLPGEGSVRLAAGIAAADEATRSALAAAPDDSAIALNRAQFLRSVGRPAEALAAAQPFLADVEQTAAGNSGNWLVNEAVYALLDLGRRDEAVSVMARLAAVGGPARSELISQRINYGAVLRRAGRHGEALAHARRFEAAEGSQSNDYARMWNASTIVCALADLGRAAEGAETLTRLRGQEAANPAALTRSLLCVGDLDAAEALVLRRLSGGDADAVVNAFQDYALGPADERDDPIARRWRALRERPAVRTALERVGTVRRLPLAQTYWGAY